MNKKHSIPLNFVLASGMLLAGIHVSAFAQDAQPDNSKMNSGDQSKSAMTADKQKGNKNDREMAAQIRKAIVADKSLSVYAHNVKIISRSGMVTLKGPVRSDEEKTNVEQKAADIAGAGKVTNQMTVAPAKTKS